MDAELQKIAPENERGQLAADKFFKVALLSGKEIFLYLYIELKFRDDLAVYEQKEKPMTVDTLLSPDELMKQEKGRREGLQTGRQEGRQEASRDAVLDVLEVRLGAVPEEVVQRVRSLTDEPRLRQASRLAATVSSFADFLARS